MEAFDIAGISKSPAIFDLEKLKYFNSAYIKALAPADFLAAAEPYLKQAIHNPAIDLQLVAPLVQTRLDTLTEIPPMVGLLRRPAGIRQRPLHPQEDGKPTRRTPWRPSTWWCPSSRP